MNLLERFISSMAVLSILLGSIFGSIVAKAPTKAVAVAQDDDAEAVVRGRLAIIIDDGSESYRRRGLGPVGNDLLKYLSDTETLVIVNCDFWENLLSWQAEFCTKAMLKGSAESYLNQWMKDLFKTATELYETLSEKTDIISCRSTILNVLRSEFSLLELQDSLEKESLTYRDLNQALASQLFLHAAPPLERKIMFRLNDDFYLVIDRALIQKLCRQQQEMLKLHDIIALLNASFGLQLSQDMVVDAGKLSEFFKDLDSQEQIGQLDVALTSLFDQDNKAVHWDCIFIGHGLSQTWSRSESEAKILAQLSPREFKKVLRTLDEVVQCNSVFVKSCYSGGKTIEDLSNFSTQQALHFPIISLTSFDSVSWGWVAENTILADKKADIRWDVFAQACFDSIKNASPKGGALQFDFYAGNNELEAICYPVTPFTLDRLEKELKKVVPPRKENISAVIFSDQDPIILFWQQIAPLDAMLAAREKRCLNVTVTSETAEPLLLRSCWIDCDVLISGKVHCIPADARADNYYVRSLELKNGQLDDLFDIYAPIMSSRSKKHIILGSCLAEISDNLKELLVENKIELPVQDGRCTVNNVVIEQVDGDGPVVQLLFDTALLRMYKTSELFDDEKKFGAKYNIGFQLFAQQDIVEKQRKKVDNIKVLAQKTFESGNQYDRLSALADELMEAKDAEKGSGVGQKSSGQSNEVVLHTC